jgi:hypothetical protein
MTDLRESMSRTLADEPPLPEIAEQAVATGRRARRRRRAAMGCAAAGAGVVVVTAVAVPIAIAGGGGGGGGGTTQSVAIAASPKTPPSTSASPSTAPTAVAASGFGFDPSGPPPSCPSGQLPTVSADLAKVVAHGTYTASDQSWADHYVKPDPQLRGVGFSVAAVNGTPPSPATSYLWVLSGPSTTRSYTASVLLVRTSSSTWDGHPATFTGCQPVSK